MAVALVGGAAIGALFGVLYDVVKESMGRTVMQYKPLLEDLKFTLDCLRPRIIQEIGDHNVALGLPNDDIERLQQQMEEGIKLVGRLSKLSMWNCYVLCSCCKCSEPSYTDRLIQLDRSLRALLEVLRLQEARDLKENLLLNRKIYEKQDELATRQSEILKIAGEILRAQQEDKGVQELSGSSAQTVVQEQIGGSGVQQAASINRGGAALGAVFEVLFSAVQQTKEKTRMFKRILGHLESTLDSIKPLIEEIAEYNKVLHLTEEELESFREEMEKGVELVRKCSNVSLWASNKKYEYTNKLLGLDESLQRLINILRVQLARDAKESLDSVTNIATVTKQIEESGMIQHDQTEGQRPVVELPSATVGLDVLSVQGAGKMTKARELEEGAKKIEGSGVVQNQTEIHGSSSMVSMEESETEFEPQQVFSSEFGTIHENMQGTRPETSPRFSNWFSSRTKKRGKSGSEFEPQQFFSSEFGTIHENMQGSRPDTSPWFSNWFSSRTKKRGKSGSEYGQKHVEVFSDASSDRSETSCGSSRGIYSNPNNSRHGSVPGSVKFTMEEINMATKSFSPSRKIGQGGFGTVYKGRLGDGTFVAIKRAKKSVYDKHLGVEFQSEIQMLAQVEHLSLVKFYGYLEHEDEKIVVVEYVPNGTLRQHLDCLHGEILDLAARLEIAIDVAHAVTYLHMYKDHPIIHRDIKSSNILLTENFRAKVADFGFARLAADSDSGATHVSTQVKGTAGYLDPEYLRTYQLTEKSDVYSFGVLLVELVTGRRPIEPKRETKERITAKWAMKKFTDGDALSILDPRLGQTAASGLAIEKILELALQCLAPRGQNRPSMRRCGEILWNIRKDYKEVLSSDFRSFSSRSQISN